MISQSETNRYNIAFGNDYYFPVDLEDRFISLSNKVITLGENQDYIEAYRGYRILFDSEFKKHQVKFKKRSIWKKKTESWYGNDPQGTLVKIVKIKGSFIWYSKGIFDQRFCLNKWSFLRIFEEVRNENRKSFWFI